MRTACAAVPALIGVALGAPAAIATDLRVLGSELKAKNGSNTAQRRIVAWGEGETSRSPSSAIRTRRAAVEGVPADDYDVVDDDHDALRDAQPRVHRRAGRTP